jgi:very-short-patch-repair endonuclease
VIASVAAGSESYLEVHATARVFVGRRFRGLLRQHVVSAGGKRYRLDMYDALSMTAIELDGATYHAGISQWQRDLRRDADLAALGILTLRFSYQDLTERPEWCRSTTLNVLQLRSTRFRNPLVGAVEGSSAIQIKPAVALNTP